MTKEIAKVESGLPVVHTSNSGISFKDVTLPKLLLMQNTSGMVGDGDAKLGNIVNSMTNEVVGSTDKKCEIIPLSMTKSWRINDMTTGTAKLIRHEPCTAANENQPWEAMENGIPIRRDFCLNFYVLLKSECEEDEAFPCVITFKRTSLAAGRQLLSLMYKMEALGRACFSTSAILHVDKEKHENSTYAKFGISKGSKHEYNDVAQLWSDRIAVSKLSVHETAEDAVVASTPKSTEDIPF